MQVGDRAEVERTYQRLGRCRPSRRSQVSARTARITCRSR